MALTHAILALLVNCPQSGYDLTKNFEESVGCFWKATHQQIYRELAKLEAQGWVQPTTVLQEGRPDKKVYGITELGQQKLATWVAAPCDTMAIKEELLVKVFVGALVSTPVIQQQLLQHRQIHTHQLAHYRQIEAVEFQNFHALTLESKLQYLVLRRGIRYETDWIGWCDEALALLHEETEGKEK
ncbi:MAG: PadR family transcriptional regulator [Stenomitos rutilans HA7619-LM2]|nr:PadR family transcriptional regulator [Stenomitos rutilans HA7619-LM2]